MNETISDILNCFSIGVVIFGFWTFSSLYIRNKANLNAHIDSVKIFPNKVKFVFSFLIVNLCFFVPSIPLFWLMESRNPTYFYLWLFPLLFLFMSVPAYPYFTLSTDQKCVTGPTLWGWRWRREAMKFSEINQDKVLHQNLGKFFGITILYSKEGKKILTLGLEYFQISEILEAVNAIESDE